MSATVLVTGVGGGSGAYTSKILKETGYEVIGVDCNGYAMGCTLVDHFCVVPPVRDRLQFTRAIRALQARFNVDVILPNVDDELLTFAEEFHRREVVISPAPTVDICLDKYATWKEFYGVVDIPMTYLYQHHTGWMGFVGGVVVKPRRGRGSKDVYTFDGAWQASKCEFMFKDKDFVVQQWINGEEYTVDAYCFGEYTTEHLVFPRKRMSTYGGISQVGWTQMDKDIIEAANKVINHLDFHGPINIQFIKNDDGVFLIEINPRLSGGIGITYANGVNLPDITVKRHLGIEWEWPTIKEEIVYRYLTEGKDESTNRDGGGF